LTSGPWGKEREEWREKEREEWREKEREEGDSGEERMMRIESRKKKS
jgi:hypothetical protein